MTRNSGTWRPGVASLVANLRPTLEATPHGSESVVPDTPGEVRVGADLEGSRWLRIFCDPRSVSHDDRAAAIHFQNTADGYKVVVDRSIDDQTAFYFLENIIHLIRSGHSPETAGRAALQAWATLLARAPGRPLSESKLAGLYGELEILETIIRLGGDLTAWTGWNMDHNDFRLPGLAIEVKATTSPNYRSIKVNGLRQLADPQDGSVLILVLRRLESSPDGRSIPDLVASLIALGVPPSELMGNLTNVGYFSQHEPSYANHRFVSQEIALRRIDDEHPRLTPDLLESVVDLSCIDRIAYELNLNGDPEKDLITSLDEIVRDHLTADGSPR